MRVTTITKHGFFHEMCTSLFKNGPAPTCTCSEADMLAPKAACRPECCQPAFRMVKCMCCADQRILSRPC